MRVSWSCWARVSRSLAVSLVAAELLASRFDLRVEERTHIVACS